MIIQKIDDVIKIIQTETKKDINGVDVEVVVAERTLTLSDFEQEVAELELTRDRQNEHYTNLINSYKSALEE